MSQLTQSGLTVFPKGIKVNGKNGCVNPCQPRGFGADHIPTPGDFSAIALELFASGWLNTSIELTLKIDTLLQTDSINFYLICGQVTSYS